MTSTGRVSLHLAVDGAKIRGDPAQGPGAAHGRAGRPDVSNSRPT